ncbi:MAG TPA: hypothetical protein VGB05_05310 [Pyrinomonadaceae bacterium]|jgi:hypothetical protein
MKPAKAPDGLSREELVSFCLRQCALVVDPRNGHLKSLAAMFDWHETTLSTWIANGRIPLKACKKLRGRFGALIDIEKLSAKT